MLKIVKKNKCQNNNYISSDSPTTTLRCDTNSDEQRRSPDKHVTGKVFLENNLINYLESNVDIQYQLSPVRQRERSSYRDRNFTYELPP